MIRNLTCSVVVITDYTIRGYGIKSSLAAVDDVNCYKVILAPTISVDIFYNVNDRSCGRAGRASVARAALFNVVFGRT